ncbi:MAG: hypothetical protein EXR76_01540 [Myxococcales bacterium]|nr:hypothetical protein [Myxococcales bacterium]
MAGGPAEDALGCHTVKQLDDLEPLIRRVEADPQSLGDWANERRSRGGRKRIGSFYTPAWVVTWILTRLDLAGSGGLACPPRLLDPACGGGRFVCAVYEANLKAAFEPEAALGALVGLDSEPFAVGLTRLSLALRTPPNLWPIIVSAIRHVDALSLLEELSGGFDLVVGNPPYRGGRFAPLSATTETLRVRFSAAEYQVDPYLLFIELAARALRPGGRFGLVLPNPFMSNLRTGALRETLLGLGAVTALDELPVQTFAAEVETVVLTFERGREVERSVPVLRLTPTSACPSGFLHLEPDSPAAPWPLCRDVAVSQLVTRSRLWSAKLGDIACVTRGINPYHHSRHSPDEIKRRIHHATSRLGEDFVPELCGRDLKPFRVERHSPRFVRYGPWLKEPRDPAIFRGPRLLVRKIFGATIVAAYLEEPFVCDQSVYVVHLHPGQPWPPFALLAIVSSPLLSTLLRARHQEDDRLFPQLKVGELRGAPLPDVSPTDPIVKRLDEQAEAFVSRGAPESERVHLYAAVASLYGMSDLELSLEKP